MNAYIDKMYLEDDEDESEGDDDGDADADGDRRDRHDRREPLRDLQLLRFHLVSVRAFLLLRRDAPLAGRRRVVTLSCNEQHR